LLLQRGKVSKGDLLLARGKKRKGEEGQKVQEEEKRDKALSLRRQRRGKKKKRKKREATGEGGTCPVSRLLRSERKKGEVTSV